MLGEPQQHELAVRLFLQDHPEHIAGVKHLPDPARGGHLELMLDTRAVAAFADWLIAHDLCDVERATAFRAAVREQFGV